MVQETEDDLALLQNLIDQSIENAGVFIKNSFQMPAHSLNARQVVQLVGSGKTLVLATVTKSHKPLTAPIGTVFFRGHFYVPTVKSAMRTKHIVRNPGVSLSYYEGDDVAIIVHGEAELIKMDNTEYAQLAEIYGSDLSSWGKGNEGVFIKINPQKMFTYVSYPEKFK